MSEVRHKRALSTVEVAAVKEFDKTCMKAQEVAAVARLDSVTVRSSKASSTSRKRKLNEELSTPPSVTSARSWMDRWNALGTPKHEAQVHSANMYARTSAANIMHARTSAALVQYKFYVARKHADEAGYSRAAAGE
eukprot:SAG11_NODE_3581_length_2353_cov_2.078971_3_plen_136_part_00